MSTRSIVILTSTALCACAALVVKMIRKAPEAHEDPKGFHLGPPQAERGEAKSQSKVA